MSYSPNNAPAFTGVRLKFAPSNDLETRLRTFLNADAQEAIRKKDGRVKLISRHVKYLDLGAGTDSSGKDSDRFEKFKTKIDDKVSQHTFQLSKVVSKQEIPGGLELGFSVAFGTPAEQLKLVSEPFMTRGTKTSFDIYTAIPERALATPGAVDQAYELLELAMQPHPPVDAPDGLIAPWQMSVKDTRVETIPPRLRIAE